MITPFQTLCGSSLAHAISTVGRISAMCCKSSRIQLVDSAAEAWGKSFSPKWTISMQIQGHLRTGQLQQHQDQLPPLNTMPANPFHASKISPVQRNINCPLPSPEDHTVCHNPHFGNNVTQGKKEHKQRKVNCEKHPGPLAKV